MQEEPSIAVCIIKTGVAYRLKTELAIPRRNRLAHADAAAVNAVFAGQSRMSSRVFGIDLLSAPVRDLVSLTVVTEVCLSLTPAGTHNTGVLEHHLAGNVAVDGSMEASN